MNWQIPPPPQPNPAEAQTAADVKANVLLQRLNRLWQTVLNSNLTAVAYTQYKAVLRQQAQLAGFRIDDPVLLEP